MWTLVEKKSVTKCSYSALEVNIFLGKIKLAGGFAFSHTVMSRGMCSLSCASLLMTKLLSWHKTNLSGNQSASQDLRACRDGFIRLKEEAQT